MSDTNERSVASDGSVVGEPDAWMHISGGLSLGVFKHVDPRLRHLCVPLYRQPKPTLTDAEREAVERGYCSLMGVQDMSAECSRWDAEAASTLRGLLERTK